MSTRILRARQYQLEMRFGLLLAIILIGVLELWPVLKFGLIPCLVIMTSWTVVEIAYSKAQRKRPQHLRIMAFLWFIVLLGMFIPTQHIEIPDWLRQYLLKLGVKTIEH